MLFGCGVFSEITTVLADTRARLTQYFRDSGAPGLLNLHMPMFPKKVYVRLS